MHNVEYKLNLNEEIPVSEGSVVSIFLFLTQDALRKLIWLEPSVLN